MRRSSYTVFVEKFHVLAYASSAFWSYYWGCWTRQQSNIFALCTSLTDKFSLLSVMRKVFESRFRNNMSVCCYAARYLRPIGRANTSFRVSFCIFNGSKYNRIRMWLLTNCVLLDCTTVRLYVCWVIELRCRSAYISDVVVLYYLCVALRNLAPV